MSAHRYILKPYKTPGDRNTCPSCGEKREFARYIDTHTGNELADNVGRCNRADNCGYHYKPSEYFRDTNTRPEDVKGAPQHIPSVKPIQYMPIELVHKSMGGYAVNSFVVYLNKLFGPAVAGEVIERYKIGSSKYRFKKADELGPVVFWQINKDGFVHCGKLMQYNPTTGKRIKKLNQWVHVLLQIEKQPSCFFGEHLLHKAMNRVVCIVESEKTAAIASVYFPQYIWIATAGQGNINIIENRIDVLRGHRVVLFPDVKAFADWNKKAGELKSRLNVSVSDYLERRATEAERNEGVDLADLLIKYDYKEFLKPVAAQPKQEAEAMPPALERMCTKNPNILNLIKRFDLKVEYVKNG